MSEINTQLDQLNPTGGNFLSNVNLSPEKQKLKRIDVSQIKRSPFQPRKAINSRYKELKDSIERLGLLQPFSVTYDIIEAMYVITKGGNTRLSVIQDLYRETGAEDYQSILCIVEEDCDINDMTQRILTQLAENDNRGELILVDKAVALAMLENNFYDNKNLLNSKRITSNDDTNISKSNNLSSIKNPAGGADFFEQKSYNKTKDFLKFLLDNGYAIGEQTLSTFRFTANHLVGCLDFHLNNGLGGDPINKIRKSYNNAQRLFVKNNSDKAIIFDELWVQAVKKYTQKKSFDFDKLINVLASEFNRMPFCFGEHGNEFDITPMVKQLTQTKKDKQAAQKQQEAIEKITQPYKSIEPTEPIKPIDPIDTAKTTAKTEKETPPPLGSLGVDDDCNATKNNDKYYNENNLTGDQAHAATPGLIHIDDKDNKAIDHSDNRLEIQKLVSIISKAYDLGDSVIDIDIGCGYLVIKKPKKIEFNQMIVFHLLLSFSLAVDIQHLIVENSNNHLTQELIDNSDIDETMDKLYKITNPNSLLLEVEKLFRSDLAFPLTPNIINTFKNQLKPAVWQKFSQLEFLQYQISQSEDVWTI